MGVDIGGTNARAGIVERAKGTLIHAEKEALVDRSPEAVVEVVGALIQRVAGQRSVPVDAPVGVGFAGMLNGSRVVNAPNLGWHDEVDFGAMMAKRTGRAVKLINDLSAAAWGEFSGGSARGATDTFTVFCGTGVGGALISNGRLVGGSTGVAGEFGHIKVVLEGGRPCGCGQLGCLEAYMGGARLEAWMHEVGLRGHATDLEEHARRDLPRARALYDFAVDNLGLAIANQVTVLNPAVVVLGGGVLSKCPGMITRVTSIVQNRANAAALKSVRVVMAQLGDDAGLVGAALLG